MPALGINLDGVLADYWTAYLRRLRRAHAALSPATPMPTSVAGSARAFSPAVRGHVWQDINASPTFWVDLSPYPDTPDVLRRLEAIDRVYFLTRRYGTNVRSQTATWLTAMGYHRHPSVLVVPTDRDKAALASTLQLTGVIDDSISVGRALRRGAPRCAFRLIAQPWNQTEQVERGRRHLRVQTVHTALDDLLGAESWGASSACTQPTRQ
tara:strand:- start:89 stop:718 length:630 start_codon:yes stop_codon:yes gene_type:complete